MAGEGGTRREGGDSAGPPRHYHPPSRRWPCDAVSDSQVTRIPPSLQSSPELQIQQGAHTLSVLADSTLRPISGEGCRGGVRGGHLT